MSLTNGRFQSSNRLKRPEEFRKVFSSKLRSSDNSLLLIARKNGTDNTRLGLAVPKKHIQQSVKRNRIKRLIRESFRLNKDQLQGLDIVVVIKQDIKNDQLEFKKKLKQHWDKISK